MKTYTCDRCGHEEHDKKGIVGGEFNYHGFQTLAHAYRWDNVVDVCGPCFDKLRKEASKADRDAEQSKLQRFFDAVKKWSPQQDVENQRPGCAVPCAMP